jgi:NRPS condensation-like uncharacterized protein
MLHQKTIIMKTLKALTDFVKDSKNDLQGFQRQLIVDNLYVIEKRQKEVKALLELVVEDFEDGEVSQSVINKIKNQLR